MSGLFMYASYSFYEADEAAERSREQADAPHPRQNYFNDLAIEAQAAYVYDVSTGRVLYQKNAEVPLPLASITKAMTAIVAEEAGETAGSETLITINDEALLTDGDSGLKEGEKWEIGKLLSFMLISSSNDGAAAVAGAFPEFVKKMNTKAEELGLSTLSFKNPTGLDFEETNETGGYGSAKDVAILFEYAIKEHPELLESTTHIKEDFSSDTFAHSAKNTNSALTAIPNSIASKTGFTLKAGGNLAMVFDRGINEPVIMVVLGSSYDGRFSDIESLASTTLKTYNQGQ